MTARIITLEEHFVTPAYISATAGLESGMGGGPRIEAIQKKLLDLADIRIADMDAAGIDLQVLSFSGILMDRLDSPTATAIARDANDIATAAVNAHPDRFAAFAALNLKEPAVAATEFKRCVQELGFVGAMVDGTTDGLFLDHPRFMPVLEAAHQMRVPIYLHPAPPPQPVRDAYYSGLPGIYGQLLSIAGWGWHVETGLHALRIIVSGVFDRMPELQIIIGHMGENLPFSVARANSVLSNAPGQLRRPVLEYFRSNFHITTSGYFTVPPFQCALSVVGEDRLLFSVDYPYSANTTGTEFLGLLPVSEEVREKVAHGNAERLLHV